MKTILLFSTLITSLLYADPSAGDTEMIIEGEQFTQEHQSTYGVSNNYALVVAEHHIYATSGLFFYYGTKVGLVIEDHTAKNGFGPNAELYGLVYKADAGISYHVDNYYTLNGTFKLEGSHAVNELAQQEESLLNLGYQYKF